MPLPYSVPSAFLFSHCTPESKVFQCFFLAQMTTSCEKSEKDIDESRIIFYYIKC